MKRTGLWLCAVSTLALGACHRPTAPAASKPAATANAAAQPAALEIAPAATPADTAPPPAVVKTSATANQRPGAAAPSARAGRHGVTKPAIAHRRSVHDHAHKDRPAHGRASPGQPVIAGRDARGDIARFTARSSSGYRACISAAHGFTAALGECHSAELARQGERMNALYGEALTTVRADARLQQSQSAWKRRRDAECQAVSTAEIEIQREGACRVDMTARRADELERLVRDRRRGRS